MHIKTEFPHAIREIENCWIPLSDGIRLAARIWLPVDAEENPVPAVLEYLPYRKSDGTAVRDAIRHPYLAGHGYAAIRVDMRGSGDSDGILYDEYLQQEQDDALELLAWIAEQPWCTGNIGIFGKSWGGFNALQIAARRPPQLKAIIPMHFTDDRYADDVHYMGGCVLGSQMLAWAAVMFLGNALPPDPRWVGDRWREMWLGRMAQTPPYVEEWLIHQRRDAFWQHGSVCENYADIECAVYAVGGWADAYTNAVPRLLAGLSCPKKGIIGPWAHNFPEDSRPGPAVGFLQESLRWWDYWLKGIDNGILNEPMLRTWLEESQPPSADHEVWPGRWVADPAWPSPHVERVSLELESGGGLGKVRSEKLEARSSSFIEAEASLAEKKLNFSPVSFKGMQTTGLDTGEWCAYGVAGDFPIDQRAEDGRSLCFTTRPLAERMEIMGYPELTLTVSADQPHALIAARLCDVAPDGASTLVSWGLLNLTHRDSHLEPTPLEIGKQYTVTIQLNAIAYALPAGHSWRIALSPTYWPHAWPSPQAATLTFMTDGGCQLHLPVREASPEDEALAPLQAAEAAAPYPLDVLRVAGNGRLKRHNAVTGISELEVYTDEGRIRLRDNGLIQDGFNRDIFSIKEGDPLSATAVSERRQELQRGDWQVRIETKSIMTSTATEFIVSNELNAYEGATRVFAKTWNFKVPRDLV